MADACGEDRIFWAGEAACDMLGGYMHSAYFAGRKAAAQVAEARGLGRAPRSICDRDPVPPVAVSL